MVINAELTPIIASISTPVFAIADTTQKTSNELSTSFIMIFVGLGLIALGVFRYNEVAGWGFAAVGLGFFAIAWVFNALKGRV